MERLGQQRAREAEGGGVLQHAAGRPRQRRLRDARRGAHASSSGCLSWCPLAHHAASLAPSLGRFCQEAMGGRALRTGARPAGRSSSPPQGDEKCNDKEHPFCKSLPGEWKLLGVTVGEIKIKEGAKGGDDDVRCPPARPCCAAARSLTLSRAAQASDHTTPHRPRTPQAVKAFVPTLYRLREGGGIAKVSKGQPPINKLLPDGVFLFDTGFELFMCAARLSACVDEPATGPPRAPNRTVRH